MYESALHRVFSLRVSLGIAVALTELVLVLAILIRSFKIELSGARAVVPTAIVTIQPGSPPAFHLGLRKA